MASNLPKQKNKNFKSSKPLQKPITPFKQWSVNRPVKATMEDALADQLFGILQARIKERTLFGWADTTGLSESTIKHYEQSKVKRPQALSLQMLADALGGKIVLVPAAQAKPKK